MQPSFSLYLILVWEQGRESISDDFRSGRPAVVTCFIKDSVKDMVNIVRVIQLTSLVFVLYSIWDLTEELGMSNHLFSE